MNAEEEKIRNRELRKSGYVGKSRPSWESEDLWFTESEKKVQIPIDNSESRIVSDTGIKVRLVPKN